MLLPFSLLTFLPSFKPLLLDIRLPISFSFSFPSLLLLSILSFLSQSISIASTCVAGLVQVLAGTLHAARVFFGNWFRLHRANTCYLQSPDQARTVSFLPSYPPSLPPAHTVGLPLPLFYLIPRPPMSNDNSTFCPRIHFVRCACRRRTCPRSQGNVNAPAHPNHARDSRPRSETVRDQDRHAHAQRQATDIWCGEWTVFWVVFWIFFLNISWSIGNRNHPYCALGTIVGDSARECDVTTSPGRLWWYYYSQYLQGVPPDPPFSPTTTQPPSSPVLLTLFPTTEHWRPTPQW